MQDSTTRPDLDEDPRIGFLLRGANDALRRAEAAETRASALEETVRRLTEALKPFAAFHKVLVTMGRITPRAGALYSLQSTAGEAEITAEHLARAAGLLSTPTAEAPHAE